MYYFAYGSNMNEFQMKDRCPSASLIGTAKLDGYKLAFTIYSEKRKSGCADVVKDKGNMVYGLLYEITTTDIDKLDVFEHHPIKYRRFTGTVTTPDSQPVDAEIYEVVGKELTHQVPSSHYLGLLIDAAEKFDFPEEYKKELYSYKE